ncbi:insulinase family protein [Candidatus Parcubacteria bacterium]|nr:insulinase family protein [Candidatus Parcubacteria bacterium]
MQFQKHILKNGTRLIAVPQDSTGAFTVLVLFSVGSRYETRNINGISHFIEHLMFKGTKRRPNTLSISRELDQFGAEYNAFTSKDYTGYYIKINAEHRKIAMDIVSDMLYNSKLDEKEVNRERNVILEEIHMYRDNPIMHIEDMLEEEIFGDTPLGWSIAGYEKTMAKITRKDIVNFYNKHYIPKNTVVVFSGDLKSMNIKKDGEKYFGKKKGGKPATKYPPFIGQMKSEVRIDCKETGQFQLAIGLPGLKYDDKDMPALGLLTNILGGTMSSRLFIQIRERRGLAYFVRAMLSPYQDTGAFVIRAGLNKGKLELAIKTIFAELEKIKKSGVTALELKRAKENIKGSVILDMEDSSFVASWLGKQELLTNKTESLEEKIKQMERVKLADIKRIANKLFKKEKASIAIIGPLKNSEKIKKIIN